MTIFAAPYEVVIYYIWIYKMVERVYGIFQIGVHLKLMAMRSLWGTALYGKRLASYEHRQTQQTYSWVSMHRSPSIFGCDFYKRIRYSTARAQIFGSPYGFFWPGFSPRLRTDMDWLMLTQYAEWLMENFDGCFNRVLDESNHQNNQGHCAIQKTSYRVYVLLL